MPGAPHWRNARVRAKETMTDTLVAQASTATDRAIVAGREALAGRRGAIRSILPFGGPAIIASVAYMDPGNFATNIQAGAKYGYNLLWVVVFANAVAMLFQGLSAKLGIVTGRNLAERSEEHTSELQSHLNLVCRLLLEKKK